MLAPPFVITEDQVDELVSSLGRALTRVAERLGAAR
jgi:adenosylmethionine-8-amino-7-oxononanoate aminotransferase